MKQIFAILTAVIVVGCATNLPPDEKDQDRGPEPVGYEAEITEWLKSGLKDPYSAHIDIEKPIRKQFHENGFAKWKHAWSVKAWVNAKNEFGAYAGREPYWFYYINGKIAYVARPWEVEHAEWGKP